MSKEKEILLELIGIGLGFKRLYHPLENSILAVVLKLALEQGVIGIVFDGFKSIRGEQNFMTFFS